MSYDSHTGSSKRDGHAGVQYVVTPHSGQRRATFGVAALVNVLTSLALAALVALAVYVNLAKFIVGQSSNHGYHSINIDATTWNVACTIVGTAVGLMSAVSLASQDDVLTRKQIASPQGVVAIFLKPLTLRRGAEQIYRLRSPFERSFLLLLTVISTLATASVVALFGIKPSIEIVHNPAASFPLFTLNATTFEKHADGGTYPTGPPASQQPYSGQLGSFIYRSALIAGAKALDRYDFKTEKNLPLLQEAGPIGDTTYADLNTGGIGTNVTSYLSYNGDPDGFDMPSRFEFQRLRGHVFGTHVTVSCTNVTEQYTATATSLPAFGRSAGVMNVAKPSGANVTLYAPPTARLYSLTLGSDIRLDKITKEPIHTVVVPDFISDGAFVLDCTYSGREYRADVSVASPSSPIVVDKETYLGPFIGPIVKQRLANTTHMLIERGGGGVAQAWLDVSFNAEGYNNTSVLDMMETILGQTAEAYISLMRQGMEKASLFDGKGFGDLNGWIEVEVTVIRLGGSTRWYAWLAVLGILLIGTLWGSIRVILPAQAVAFEAQDVLKLLGNVPGFSLMSGMDRVVCGSAGVEVVTR